MLENASLGVLNFKISRGCMPPDTPKNSRLRRSSKMMILTKKKGRLSGTIVFTPSENPGFAPDHGVQKPECVEF